MHPEAHAAWYVSQHGSATAALAVVYQPGHNDAHEREVCEILRSMQYAESVAAKAALYLNAQVAA